MEEVAGSENGTAEECCIKLDKNLFRSAEQRNRRITRGEKRLVLWRRRRRSSAFCKEESMLGPSDDGTLPKRTTKQASEDSPAMNIKG